MKGFRIAGVGVAVIAVIAFSAIAVASSASAAVVFLLAEWLNNGAAVTATLLSLGEGQLLLENKNAPFIKSAASISCSGVLDGSVGADGADEITELLTLTPEELVSKTPLAGVALSCTKGTGDAVCENGSKVWAVHLPWLTLLVLWEEGGTNGLLDLILPTTNGNPGWYVECKTALVTLSEECTTPEGVAEQVNVTGGVNGVFSEAFTLLMELPLALCTGNNEETGNVEGTGLTSLPGGGTLTVSSEG